VVTLAQKVLSPKVNYERIPGMNAPQSKPDPQRANRPTVVRRRVSRQRTESNSLDNEIPVLLRLPDLLAPATAWRAPLEAIAARVSGTSVATSSPLAPAAEAAQPPSPSLAIVVPVAPVAPAAPAAPIAPAAPVAPVALVAPVAPAAIGVVTPPTTNDAPSIRPSVLPPAANDSAVAAAAFERSVNSTSTIAATAKEPLATAIPDERVGGTTSATPLGATAPSAASEVRPTSDAITLQSVVRQVTELNAGLSSSQPIGPRHEAAANRADHASIRPEPAGAQRERRRRYDDDLPLDTQSMTRQWATVLVLVAVISTSFYLLNRPRNNGESQSGSTGDSTSLDGVARKTKGVRAKSPSRREDLESESEYSLDEGAADETRSGADSGAGEGLDERLDERLDEGLDGSEDVLMEPKVPPPLSRWRGERAAGEAAAAESSSLDLPLDDVSTVIGRNYPATDPRRYEFSPDSVRSADRGGLERSR
jgi:hypothetical protein